MKIVSENRFSGKTVFYTIVSRNIAANLYMSAGMTIMMSVTMAVPMLLVSYFNGYGDRGWITEMTMYLQGSAKFRILQVHSKPFYEPITNT